jgi:hypothetical protein
MRLIDRLVERIADRVTVAWQLREARRREHLEFQMGKLSARITDKLAGLHVTVGPPKPRA